MIPWRLVIIREGERETARERVGHLWFFFSSWFMICNLSISVFHFLLFPLFYDGVIPYIYKNAHYG